jgi:hypothetical protein
MRGAPPGKRRCRSIVVSRRGGSRAEPTRREALAALVVWAHSAARKTYPRYACLAAEHPPSRNGGNQVYSDSDSLVLVSSSAEEAAAQQVIEERQNRRDCGCDVGQERCIEHLCSLVSFLLCHDS